MCQKLLADSYPVRVLRCEGKMMVGPRLFGKQKSSWFRNPPGSAVHQVRLGIIKAALLKNETESHMQFHVTFERLSKRATIGDPPDPFEKGELLQLGKVASEAHGWIFAQAAKA